LAVACRGRLEISAYQRHLKALQEPKRDLTGRISLFTMGWKLRFVLKTPTFLRHWPPRWASTS